MSNMLLSPIVIEPLVRAALCEDLGRAGDITTNALVPDGSYAQTALVARQDGLIAGIDAALLAFRLIEGSIDATVLQPDGNGVSAGETIATICGPAKAILGAERVALNFLCHLSGVATATAYLVNAVRGYRARICCTRKTTPGLRALEKYAVRVGGGLNHRFGLDDAVIIKDNHVAIAGGIRPAVERVRAVIGHLVKVEVEVDTLDQLEEVLNLKVDAVLLDNMSVDDLRRAVVMVDRRVVTEASGGVTRENAPLIAASGVDLISVGWLTHSAPALDIGLDHVGRLNGASRSTDRC
jgi:nicotinate-nucleotide pyrophosphorylase (carboxylating)